VEFIEIAAENMGVRAKLKGREDIFVGSHSSNVGVRISKPAHH
jgi:hypothetical protein